MTTEENKGVVRHYIEDIFNTGNLALIEEVVPAELVDRVRRVISFFHRAFPDWQITIEETIAEGDKV
jgi:predicted ester cyclase